MRVNRRRKSLKKRNLKRKNNRKETPMIDVEGITKVLSDFKVSHAKNARVVMGNAPEMGELFGNFRNSARACFNDPQDVPDVFSVMDNTHLRKGDELKRVTISRLDVLMMLDDSDSKGFKLFGRHNEKPGQFGILFTKQGVVALNRSSDEPGRRGGFISWVGHQFCQALLVDKRRSESFDYETDAYPGKFVFMCNDCGLKSDELYENVTEKIEKLLGCNRDWVEVVKGWGR